MLDFRSLPAVELRRLHPDAGVVPVLEAAAALREPAPPAGRPKVAVNMVASLDGHATFEGRTQDLGSEADRQLFHALREHADAVMAGAGTVRVEGYGPTIKSDERKARRAARGLEPMPLAVVVSGSLNLPADLPLLQDPESRVVIITASPNEIPGTKAQVDYWRAPEEGAELELRPFMERLRSERGVEYVLCEGGPTLNRDLLAEGLMDELFLALSPQLLGGAVFPIVNGTLPGPVESELLSVHEGDGDLFLRYRTAS